MSLSELSEYLAVRIGFYEKDFLKLPRSGVDSQYVPFITIEHLSSKEGHKNKKKLLAEVLLNPRDFNFGELETYDCR